MNWKDPRDRLDLYDDQPANYQVKTIATLDYHISIPQRKGDLPVNLDAPESQLSTDTGLISGLEQPRTQLSVHSIAAPTMS